ncbi:MULTISPECIES: VOC family protein [unclassified Meridianimarinicoccus]|uniref:VOC family protein n=1 Tax=unclassified Meridianimarinicoccus TaxID=2923344 RepID=UPI001868B7F5|nr:VOC family protein [Fluviibacterium sp. MJW13]
MATITGIGGVFFRARDPQALAAWYDTHFGINPVPQGPDDTVWMQAAGPTVFAPFAEDTEYFGRKEQQFMLNFRVPDLDAAIADLRAAGIEVTPWPQTPEMEAVGRFAHLTDPEGNRVELWQPAG